ncbi:ABC transporter substrate-binding protein [Lentzea albida]|uniref:Peptide/nickel transport system substrate-binding protein n=1 Tax=Lentzea albida TaxID=65499 RepID=A0A1H9EQE5_9PSEU|nr:ABC transporter substrate-binding protein [Lentzea albida]SEQ27879.1 peptide/nickel transport system substrate-binding protein [Lentzea albida]
MNLSRTTATWLAVFAVSTALTGCSGAAESDRSSVAHDADIPKLTWAVAAGPRSLDIAHSLDGTSYLAIAALFDSVLRLDMKGNLESGLAESWSSPDSHTYVYRIRRGVKFWNDEPVTAEDVRFSLARQLDPATASESAQLLAAVKSVEVSGPDQVTVRLSHPDAAFQYTPALAWFVQQKSYVEAAGEELGTGARPGMGSGAYTVESFSPAGGVALRRNEQYWGAKPKVVSAEIKPIAVPEALRRAVQAGEVDGTIDFPVRHAQRWEQLRGVRAQFVRSTTTTYLSLDTATAPFDDEHVRRAIAHSVDRKGLLAPAFGGRADLAASPFTTAQLTATVGEDRAAELTESIALPEFDLGKAAAELKKSRHPNGFTVDAPYAADEPWAQLTLEDLARNLARIGIRLTPKPMPRQQWVAQIYAHQDLGIQIIRAGGGTPYAGELASVLFVEDSARPNGFNTANFHPDEVRQVVDQIGAPSSAEARFAQLRSLMALNAEQLGYVPLFEPQTGIALRDEFVFDPQVDTFLVGDNWLRLIKSAK